MSKYLDKRKAEVRSQWAAHLANSKTLSPSELQALMKQAKKYGISLTKLRKSNGSSYLR